MKIYCLKDRIYNKDEILETFGKITKYYWTNETAWRNLTPSKHRRIKVQLIEETNSMNIYRNTDIININNLIDIESIFEIIEYDINPSEISKNINVSDLMSRLNNL